MLINTARASTDLTPSPRNEAGIPPSESALSSASSVEQATAETSDQQSTRVSLSMEARALAAQEQGPAQDSGLDLNSLTYNRLAQSLVYDRSTAPSPASPSNTTQPSVTPDTSSAESSTGPIEVAGIDTEQLNQDAQSRLQRVQQEQRAFYYEQEKLRGTSPHQLYVKIQAFDAAR